MNDYDNLNMLCRYSRAFILHLFGSVHRPNNKICALIYLMLLDDFDASLIYNWGIYCLGMLVQTYMSCMYEEGQTSWGMFTTSTCMNRKFLNNYLDFKCFISILVIIKMFLFNNNYVRGNIFMWVGPIYIDYRLWLPQL